MPLIGTSTSASAKGYGMLASGYPVAGNPSFNNVSLLLHGDGTNGAQNNTFIDSSTNALAVTRSGSATQGTFTPFSQTGWSNYFNGNTDYLSAGTSLFNYTTANSSTQTATIEAFVYITAYGIPSQPYYNACIISKGDVYVNFGINSSGNLVLQHYDGSQRVATSTGTIPLNTWTYVACTISGGVVTLYINGSSSGTGTWFGIASAGQNSVSQIARASTNASNYFSGYISNIRVSTNVRTIATPTVAYSSDANTALLTCQSNRIVDNSGNAIALTITGTPSTQAFSPFAPTAVYDTTVVGGSAYFDVGQYLITGTSTGLDLSNGVFTVECWVNKTATSSQNLFHFKGATGTSGISIWTNASNQLQIDNGVSGTVAFTTLAIPAGQWAHIAIVRNAGGTTTAYINGALAGSTTSFTPNASDRVVVAGFGATPSGTFAGYIANARIVKGTAVYTTAFTPPTSLLTETTNGGATPSVNPGAGNCSLLLNFANAGIFDNAARNNLITAGSAQVSSAQVKFGTGSMLFNGTTDYLLSPSSVSASLGSGDFTIEFWINPSSVASESVIVDLRSGAASIGPTVGFAAGGAMYFQASGTSVITGETLAASAWYHVAISKSSNNTKLFVNGVQSGSTYSTAYTPTSPARVCIGARDNGTFGLYFNGYIDDLRITKGVAVYTQNFTPYPQAFPNS